MPDSRLTIVAETQGTAQAAADLQKVADAQQRLLAGQGGSRAGPATEAELLAMAEMQYREAITEVADAQENLASKQDKLHASERTYLGLLRQVSPTLAYYVEALSRSVKVAGDLAAKNLELNDMLKAGKDFIKENANGLLLLGAGGAVVAGISAISNAIVKMGKDFEQATKAIEDQQKALNELKRAQQDQQQTIESISDKRREGGLTADQSRAAEQEASAIGKRFGKSISTESINRAEALLGGQGLSDDQMADAAFLMDAGKLELDEKARPEARRRAFDRALRRNAADIAKFRAREGTQAAEARQEAAKEALAVGGTNLDLEQAIRDALGPGAGEEQVKRQLELVGKFPTTGALREGVARGTGVLPNLLRPITRINELIAGETPAIPEGAGVPGTGGILEKPVVLSAPELVDLTKVLTQLDQTLRDKPSVHIETYQPNAKNIVPGQRAQEAAMMNGAARARAAEE